MPDAITLGARLRELREFSPYSLRELARELEISAPFLSDIELGRRFPSDQILEKLARKLGVSAIALRELDTRASVSDMKRLVDASPNLGLAFKAVVRQVNSGKLTSDEIVAKLKELHVKK
jgi:transcriptional regulator with XRE-family HTH domain